MANFKVGKGKRDFYGRDHSDRSPFPAIGIDVFDRILMHSKFPPVCGANGEVASGPEEQGCISEERYDRRGPNPNVLAGKLFCFVVVTNPAPILARHSRYMTNQKNLRDELTPSGVS